MPMVLPHPSPALLLRTAAGLLARAPALPQQALLEALLNRALAEPLRTRALDWLDGRWLGLRVEDAPLAWRFSLRSGRIHCRVGAEPADVLISAAAPALLLLASGREDADTLFFQRRLRISGDTELGLAVKNSLDAHGPAALPRLLRGPLLWLAARLPADGR